MNCICCFFFASLPTDWMKQSGLPPAPLQYFSLILGRQPEVSKLSLEWRMEGRSKVSHKSLKWAQCARTSAVDIHEEHASIHPSFIRSE